MEDHSGSDRIELNALRDIREILIPFFEKHKLHSKKQQEFQLFKAIFKLVEDKSYKTVIGLRQVEKLKIAMNHRTRWMR